jgi:hypothetical protein
MGLGDVGIDATSTSEIRGGEASTLLTPDFPSRLGALARLMRLLRRKPHTRALGGPRSRSSGESGNYVIEH